MDSVGAGFGVVLLLLLLLLLLLSDEGMALVARKCSNTACCLYDGLEKRMWLERSYDFMGETRHSISDRIAFLYSPHLESADSLPFPY